MGAILAPLLVGFLIGPQCLMGVLAGAVVTGCMLAILMSNAGGAWDNSKKLCEKLKIKKTDQGKACVVGDTVGDPFKDTSGPSLDILLKLMSMIALMTAPLIDGNEDYENWWIGLIPSVLLLGATAALIQMGILSWKDPLANAKLGEHQDVEPATPATPEKKETKDQVSSLRLTGDPAKDEIPAPKAAWVEDN